MTLDRNDTIDGFSSETEKPEQAEPEVQSVYEVQPLQTPQKRAETREISKVVVMSLPRSTGKWSLWMRAVSYVVAIAVGAFGNHLWMTTSQQGKLTTSTVTSATPTHQEVVSAVGTETANGSSIESTTVEVVPTKQEVKLTETWLDQYTTRERDTLSAIAQHYCDNPMSYAGIAVDNSIKNPDVIPIGKTLNIRCRDATEEEWNSLYPDDPVDIEEPTQEEKEPATQVAGSELQVPSIDSPTRVPDETITVIATDEVSSTTDDTQVNPVDSDDAKAEPEVTTTKVDEVKTLTEERERVETLGRGVHELVIDGQYLTGLPEGIYPSFVLTDQGKDGRWELIKDVVGVNKMDSGDYVLRIQVQKPVKVIEPTSVAFDYGGESPMRISAEDIANKGNLVSDVATDPEVDNSAYNKLYTFYPKKPGKWSRVRNVVIKYGIPVAGIATSVSTGGISSLSYELAPLAVSKTMGWWSNRIRANALERYAEVMSIQGGK